MRNEGPWASTRHRKRCRFSFKNKKLKVESIHYLAIEKESKESKAKFMKRNEGPWASTRHRKRCRFFSKLENMTITKNQKIYHHGKNISEQSQNITQGKDFEGNLLFQSLYNVAFPECTRSISHDFSKALWLLLPFTKDERTMQAMISE